MLTLERMTPEQKIGRVLCFRRFKNQDDIDFTLELVKNQAAGVLQIPFNENTRELIKTFREAADYPLLIVNDMERGVPSSPLPKIPLISLSATGNAEHARNFAAITAKEAKELGYSGCWSPIVDILHQNGPCKVPRTLSDNPSDTTNIAREILKVFKSYNFQGTGKHYPGGDSGNIDTHMAEFIGAETKEELLNFDLVPYTELDKEGLLPAIMVGHKVLGNIDPDYPSSMSKKVIDIIREQGFDGVMYTDSFAMMAILQKYGEADAYVTALNAGIDVVLINYRTPTKEAYKMMLDAYRAGKISDERLNEAVRRVMKLEEFCAAVPENPYPCPADPEKALLDITRDCIASECDEGLAAALPDPQKPRLFVVTTAQDYSEEASAEEISLKDFYNPKRVTAAIKENFPTSEIQYIREYPTGLENDRILAAATKYDEVVFVSFCATSAYYGTDCMTRRLEALINALIISKKLSALVHFGNPLALEPLMHVPRKIFGFTAPHSQTFAIEVLAGKIPAKGHIPFPRLYKKN
ncbi:MAG: glycoside hydrolase family 3 protein [Clostridia bacterium]|nr:glycoside hydrolase family 3 protein [Clostridia bacterium]